MNIDKSERRILVKIAVCFAKIATLESRLTPATKDKIISLHNEMHSLPHCIRFGKYAVEEILSEIKR